MTWAPAPFQHAVTIELWAELHGVDAWFTLTDIPVDEADGATEYLRARILALQARLAPAKPPRKPRKRKAIIAPTSDDATRNVPDQTPSK